MWRQPHRGDTGLADTIYWIDASRFDTKVNKSPWLEMGDSLSAHGFDVVLLCGYEKRRFRPQGRTTKINYFWTPRVAGVFKGFLMVRILSWLVGNANATDIVIVRPESLLCGLVLRAIRRCHVHLDVRTVPVEVRTPWNRFERLLYWTLPLALFASAADSYSFITDSLRESVEQEFGARFGNHVIWNSGVNTRLFAPRARKARSDRGTFVLLYQGTVSPNRGLDLVVHAISRMRREYRDRLLFRVVGLGSYLEALRTLCADLGVRAAIEGYRAYEDMPTVIGEADCCICPLPNRKEWDVSSPLKVVEYLACGKPVIVTPLRAHRDAVGDARSVVWTDGYGVDDFAAAIAGAMDDVAELEKRAVESVGALRGRYDWSRRADKLARYLRCAAGTRRGGRA